MLSKEFRKTSIAFLVLMVASALAWADNKKPTTPAKPSTPAKSTTTHTTTSTTHTTTTAGHTTTTTGHTTTTTHTTTTGARPGSTMSARPGGGAVGGHPAAGGAVHGAAGRSTTTRTLPGGRTASVTTRANGRVASIHANGMTINHGIHGGRTISSERNGRLIVNNGRRGGFVQRPYFSRGGRTYYARTYVRDGHVYSRAYRGYDYHGYHYYGYVPGRFYHPGFYGWAYHPWIHPVYYGPAAWGWVGAPWYAAYPGWFTPYPVYATAGLWLTDYMIAANLQSAYQAGVEAGREQAEAPPPGQAPPPPPAPGPADATSQQPLSPEVKQAIADEVQAQLAAERTAAAQNNPQPGAPAAPAPAPAPAPAGGQVPDALNPSERVFVVATALDVTTASNQECGLTSGDVLMRLTDSPDANQNVNASVQSSKKGDCAAGQTVTVGVNDLQEMHNHFHEQMDSGMDTLASNSGKNGLPSAPDTGTTAGEVPTPPPDSGAADQLKAQQQQADQTDAQVQQ